ncbi:hypothetical protein K7432_015923 [Basidiobolus ranarum]|uniref:Secreted protein n=1 Tax=Basidiobolus ranarum TaxID=34480 RepID=A0ABR2VMD2_9FUNG
MSSKFFCFLLSVLGATSVIDAAPANCYNIPSAGACIDGCNMQAGIQLFDDYSNDLASPFFVKSLGLQCDRANPNFIPFMTSAGICMVDCPIPQQSAYNSTYKASCGWYKANKNGSTGCN